MRTLLYPLAFLTVFSSGLLAFGWIVTNGMQPAEPPRTMRFAAPTQGPDLEMLEAQIPDHGTDEAREEFCVC